MNKEELERHLRNSSMDYSLKANLYCQEVAFTPCKDCPFKNESPPVSIWEKTQKCCQRCPFEMIIWILNEEQSKIYEKLRPPEMKKKEIERAIKEGKINQVEKIMGAPLAVAPSFFVGTGRSDYFVL